MYSSGMDWEEYLVAATQLRMGKQIAALQTETLRSLDRGFGALIASQQDMANVIKGSLALLSGRLDRITGGIQALRADFDWAMGALLWKSEMQNATLRNILLTLQAPLDTQAKELRKRAEEAYVNGWYDESLNDFLESEQKNYQDFAVHQAIGTIYLYHLRPANLSKAREYFMKAGKYATPRSTYHAALAYLHAGFVCYLQGDSDAAIDCANWVTHAYPQLTEGFYNLAKFAAVARRADLAIPALEQAIRTDRNYAIKARADTDFERIESEVTSLMERLRAEARQQVERSWLPLRADLDRYTLPMLSGERVQIIFLRAEIEQDTYFSWLDAPPKVLKCRNLFDGLRLPERDRLRDEATRTLAKARDEMAQFLVPSAAKQWLEAGFLEAERLTSNISTQADAQAARDKAVQYYDAWSFRMVAGWAEHLVREVQGHGSRYWQASPNRRLLASWGNGGMITLWELPNLQVRGEAKLSSLSNPQAVFFSPDSSVLLAVGEGNDFLRSWNTENMQERTPLELRGLNQWSGGKVFSSNGATLAHWDSYLGIMYCWDTLTGRILVKSHKWGRDSRDREDLAFAPDGETLAFGSYIEKRHSRQYRVELWSRAWGARWRVLRLPDSAWHPTFAPDGSKLAFVSSVGTQLYDVQTRKEVVATKEIRSGPLSFSLDGTWLLGDSKAWNPTTGRVVDLQGCLHPFVFSPDRTTFIAATKDGTMKRFDLSTGRALSAIPIVSTPITFTEGGDAFVSVCPSGLALWYPFARHENRDPHTIHAWLGPLEKWGDDVLARATRGTAKT